MLISAKIVDNNRNKTIKLETGITVHKITFFRFLCLISLEEDIRSIKVKDGDTLSAISQEYNVSTSDILTYNNKTDEVLTPGEVIEIPIKVISSSDVSLVKKLINENKIKYIYTSSDETNDTVNDLITNYDLELIKINDMYSVDGGVTNSNENYLTIMNNNLDLIKKELMK